MKTPAYKYSITIFLVLLLVSTGFTQVEKTKEVHRTFKTNSSTILGIENKYGKVHVNTWDRNEIKLDIVVTVKQRSASRADEILDKIEFDINESSSAVRISTEINGSINTGKSENFSIDYTVSMPKGNPLEASNKYGSFYLADFDGKLNLEIKYGSMKVEDVSGKSYIQLGYGSGQIGSLSNGELDISYSKLSVDNIGDMDIFSKYSNVDFDKIGSVYLENKYGEINIGEAVGIEGEVKYGGMNVDRLTKKLILEAKYGNGVNIDWISNKFEIIKITSGYAGSTLRFERGFAAKFNGNFKYCSLKYSEEDFDFNIVHEGNNSSEYRGVLGKGSPSAEIDIDSQYGNVRIGYTN